MALVHDGRTKQLSYAEMVKKEGPRCLVAPSHGDVGSGFGECNHKGAGY